MRRTATILTLSFALSASACGVNDDATPTIDLPDSSAETTSTTEATTTSSEAETTTTEATTTTSAEETTTTETAVAGEPLDFAPPAATPLIVVGVRYDDVLNFRDDPSPSADILATSAPLDPDASIQALGSAWSAPSGVWWEVEIDGGLAWANQAFLGAPGVTIDVFAEVSAELETLDFATVEEAGLDRCGHESERGAGVGHRARVGAAGLRRCRGVRDRRRDRVG